MRTASALLATMAVLAASSLAIGSSTATGAPPQPIVAHPNSICGNCDNGSNPPPYPCGSTFYFQRWLGAWWDCINGTWYFVGQ